MAVACAPLEAENKDQTADSRYPPAPQRTRPICKIANHASFGRIQGTTNPACHETLTPFTPADWFIDYLRAHPNAIEHEWIDDGKFPVLTAPPAELKAFVLKHLKTEEAFENLDLKRVTPAE